MRPTAASGHATVVERAEKLFAAVKLKSNQHARTPFERTPKREGPKILWDPAAIAAFYGNFKIVALCVPNRVFFICVVVLGKKLTSFSAGVGKSLTKVRIGWNLYNMCIDSSHSWRHFDFRAARSTGGGTTFDQERDQTSHEFGRSSILYN